MLQSERYFISTRQRFSTRANAAAIFHKGLHATFSQDFLTQILQDFLGEIYIVSISAWLFRACFDLSKSILRKSQAGAQAISSLMIQNIFDLMCNTLRRNLIQPTGEKWSVFKNGRNTLLNMKKTNIWQKCGNTNPFHLILGQSMGLFPSSEMLKMGSHAMEWLFQLFQTLTIGEKFNAPCVTQGWDQMCIWLVLLCTFGPQGIVPTATTITADEWPSREKLKEKDSSNGKIFLTAVGGNEWSQLESRKYAWLQYHLCRSQCSRCQGKNVMHKAAVDVWLRIRMELVRPYKAGKRQTRGSFNKRFKEYCRSMGAIDQENIFVDAGSDQTSAFTIPWQAAICSLWDFLSRNQTNFMSSNPELFKPMFKKALRRQVAFN